MEKMVLHVDGMACEHCVKAVTKALTALPGIGNVQNDTFVFVVKDSVHS